MESLLIVATHNSHKTEEIREMLSAYFTRVEDLSSHPDIPPADETGTTFEENANIKAIEASRLLPGATVLADDSGLEVDVLDGKPGVFSARYSGVNATDKSNRRKLLEELEKIGEANSRPAARFRCVLSLAKDGNVLGNFDGAVEGTVCHEERGESGFGYDPVFIPEGYEETFGELSSETKNSMSHRSRALEKYLASREE